MIAALLATVASVNAQTAARVEYRDTRIAVGAALGDIPLRGVRMLDRHARHLGLRGPIEGRWYRVDRRTVVLEVTSRGAPVAKLYDHGGNGVFEQMYLASAPRPWR